MLNSIPCTENKCLLLPICKNKIKISCIELYKYFDNMCRTINRSQINDQLFAKSFSNFFPNLNILIHNNCTAYYSFVSIDHTNEIYCRFIRIRDE